MTAKKIQITATVELVTPALANQWLTGNTINRPISQATVIRYANAMAAGQWTVTNDDICFNCDGTLLNGQHRLKAVTLSGESVPMGIKRNVPVAAMRYMDRGKGRTMGQHLNFDGESHAALLAATLRALVVATTSLTLQTVGDADMYAWLDAHPEVRESVATADAARRNTDCTPTSLAVAHWLIARVNGKELADHYLHQIAHRTNEPAGSAVLAVDNRARTVKRNGERHGTEAYVALLVKAWNYYAKNKPVRALAIDAKGTGAIPPVARWTRGHSTPRLIEAS